MVSERKIGLTVVSGQLGSARGREIAAKATRRTDLQWENMITERYEAGKRIISVDTAEEFGQVLHEMDSYRDEIEAPEKVIEAFGIFDSSEELGIEPDDEGLPPEAYERGQWN